ncbi:Trans-2-enoyl-CoA reductase, mitochondrial [Cercospora beticola]|nr:Trans-2-enoyl-CoA reductase, mitochondrial [Cercospora beticola]PIA89602.1 Trans-2-enoyl-CoA reductase, mitochondrial [Cercospora beticola]
MAQLITRSNETMENAGVGSPSIRFRKQECLSPRASEVQVRFLMAPIHPLDKLVIGGRYPVKPVYKHMGEDILGYDGVAEVLAVGPQVDDLYTGDLVIPSKFGLGTWRNVASLQRSDLEKIPRVKDLRFAAILRVSVMPAYFLVEDMATLRPGEYIIQNAGTSVMAQMVIQFARRHGIKTINVIRDRDQASAIMIQTALHQLGADTVVTESELLHNAASILENKKVTLAVDSVFGHSGRALMKALSAGGTYVQLGFLGGNQETLDLEPNDIFGKQIVLRAFRGSAQLASRSLVQQQALCDWLVHLFNEGQILLPPLGFTDVPWSGENGANEVLEAIRDAQVGELGRSKPMILFEMQEDSVDNV